MKKILAYHFVGDTLRDGRPVPANGKWLVHTGPVTICETGLHASVHPFDALQYAPGPGPVLCLVECEDIVESHADKFVCRRRKIIKRHDMTEYLRYFARHCALSVIHLWDAPDVALDYLMTGDESLRAAARAAARDATWAAARDATWAAARDAAKAAWDAAGDATWAAAKAAGDATRAATWAAERDAHKAEFQRLVDEAMEIAK